MSNWYYALGETQFGPIPLEQLQRLLAIGQVAGSDLVWTEGMSDWQPAETVAQLSSQGSATPTAVSTRSQPLPLEGAPEAQAWANAGYPPAGAYPQAGVGTIGYYIPDPSQVAYAGFWLRFAAAIIDGLIIGIPVIFLRGVLAGALWPTHRGQISFGEFEVINSMATMGQVVIFWLYFAFMESSPRMATWGKVVCGIYVTDLLGNRLSFGRATGRFFGKYVSMLICYIGFIMAGLTQRKQALHDMMANALVVRCPS